MLISQKKKTNKQKLLDGPTNYDKILEGMNTFFKMPTHHSNKYNRTVAQALWPQATTEGCRDSIYTQRVTPQSNIAET